MKSRVVAALILFGIAETMTVQAVVPTNFPSFKPFMGLDYSPFRGNESPTYFDYPSLADITYDLTNNVVFIASEITTYSMDDVLSNIPALCNTYNIMCYPCGFISTNAADNTNQLNALIAVGNQNFPTTRGLVVGNEPVFDGLPPSDVISAINYVRSATHNSVPVGTRDIEQAFQDNPALVAACDFIQVDIHPYWAEMPIDNAAAWTIQQWQSLTNQFPGTRVEIGETGWPTGGENIFWSNPQVAATVANQDKYLSEFVPLAKSNGIEYFIFDFRDEWWKSLDGYGTVETNWGIFDANTVKKQGLVDYLANGFSLTFMPLNGTNANIVVPTFAGNPYSMIITTNLLTGPWIPFNFTGSAGQNETFVNVPVFRDQPGWFYRAQQNF